MKRETKSAILQALFILLLIVGIIWYIKNPRQNYIKLKTLQAITIQPETAKDGIFKFTFNNSIPTELVNSVAVLKSFTPDVPNPNNQVFIDGLINGAPPFIVKIKTDSGNPQILGATIISNTIPHLLLGKLPVGDPIVITGSGEVWFNPPATATPPAPPSA